MLSASRNYCWHDWKAQLRSLERLLDFDFRWVLPATGRASGRHLPRPCGLSSERALVRLRGL